MSGLKSYKRILTFFAHPDDETLAAGATLSALSRTGASVRAAIPATGVHSRRNVQNEAERRQDLDKLRADCLKALEVLCIKDVVLGDFADNEMDGHTLLELVHWLELQIEDFEPDLLLTHHRECTNIDHRYCYEAAVVATRPGARHIEMWCGEVPSSTGYRRPARWEPNLYVQVTELDVICKILAMQSYEGEMRPYPHPRSPEVLRALAMVRGSEAGFEYAEAFMVHRAYKNGGMK